MKFDDKSQLDTAKTALSTGMPIEGRWGAANEIGAAAIFYCSNRRDKRARKVFSGEGYRFSRRTRRYGIVSWLAVQWSGAAMRVLVFDDDEAIGRVLCKAAIKMGIDAVAVGDQDEFSAQMLSDPPHVVILDLQLGTTDGVKQLRMLASGKFAGAVVLMSGFDARVLASARELSIHLGLNVAGVLEKPAIVKSIADLASNMEMDCVAEGVESEETADLLEQIGIASIQGYLIAKPMATSEIPAWFASWMQAGAGAAAVPDRSPPMPLPT